MNARQYLNRILLCSMTYPEDMVSMVVFLALPAGRNLSGHLLGADGNVESL